MRAFRSASLPLFVTLSDDNNANSFVFVIAFFNAGLIVIVTSKRGQIDTSLQRLRLTVAPLIRCGYGQGW